MKIGTRVKVVDLKYHCKDFYGYFIKMGFKDIYIVRGIGNIEEVSQIEFVVFSIIKDSRSKFYGIIDQKGNQFLFEKEGLQKIKKSKKVKEEPTEEVKEKPFPKLMKTKNSTKVVYFTEENKGIVVVPDAFNKLYTFSDVWIMQYFEDTDEQITVTFN